MITLQNPSDEPTMEDVKKRMDELNVTGYSSIGEPSTKELMVGLDEIERITSGRRENAVKVIAGVKIWMIN